MRVLGPRLCKNVLYARCVYDMHVAARVTWTVPCFSGARARDSQAFRDRDDVYRTRKPQDRKRWAKKGTRLPSPGAARIALDGLVCGACAFLAVQSTPNGPHQRACQATSAARMQEYDGYGQSTNRALGRVAGGGAPPSPAKAARPLAPGGVSRKARHARTARLPAGGRAPAARATVEGARGAHRRGSSSSLRTLAGGEGRSATWKRPLPAAPDGSGRARRSGARLRQERRPGPASRRRRGDASRRL